MIRRPTWILLIILLILVGAAWYLSRAEVEQAGATPTPAKLYLFTAEDGLVSSIKIESKAGEVVVVTRGADGMWFIAQPEQGDADQGLAESAATQMTTLQVLTELEIEPGTVGLKPAAYTVTVGFTSAKERTFLVGDLTPTDSGYYVQKDDGRMVIVGRYGIDALLNLLTQPPYASTPTPLPATATNTIIPETSVPETATAILTP